MARSGKLNEFVLISRSESGAFVVVYGPRDNDRIRHSRGGFDTAEAAVAWVEMLDRHVSGDSRAITGRHVRAPRLPPGPLSAPRQQPSISSRRLP